MCDGSVFHDWDASLGHAVGIVVSVVGVTWIVGVYSPGFAQSIRRSDWRTFIVAIAVSVRWAYLSRKRQHEVIVIGRSLGENAMVIAARTRSLEGCLLSIRTR